MRIYRLLLARFGPRDWWPGESPFEVMTGAVLTQNTAWRNVERAIANLRALGLTTPEAVLAADGEALERALVPSGYYTVKARRLRALCSSVLEGGAGGLDPEVLRLPLEALRERLLSVNGVGPETADSIVLYAAGKPSFVVDAYTRRILSRHSLAAGDEPYEEIRALFMDSLPRDARLYNEYHALLVAAGNMYCRPRAPRCAECPLGGDPLLAGGLREAPAADTRAR
ncbi:MAG: endonuclease III domain-containing protein [Deltaproteobacteria bacterium]|jgi:endonuclease-3 related protein|nr:endonuclease III domain-containing protein [Deltaproteobacteria bacterium]